MNVLALIIGGFIGTILRFVIGELYPIQLEGFPWSTLWINLAGCLFLGWFLTITMRRLRIRPEIRLGLGTGLTGAFTTFSTFTVQTMHLFLVGKVYLAFSYICLSVAGGLILTIIGVSIAKAQKSNNKGKIIL
jgi:fluoride exporter